MVSPFLDVSSISVDVNSYVAPERSHSVLPKINEKKTLATTEENSTNGLSKSTNP
jgi:hypothetical protein